MELKQGYNNTEADSFPDDWRVECLGKLAETGSGTTPTRSRSDRYYRNGTIPWVKTLDLNNGEIVATEESVTAKALAETALQLYPAGTVVVAMYGGFNQIGRTGILRTPATVNQALTAIRPCVAQLCPEYLQNVLNYRVAYWRSVASSSRKDPNITGADVRAFPVPVPPTLKEQCAIAEALGDADTLLDGLDRLIAKKRDVKHAAGEQLLTGQTRLPGFHDKWSTENLASVICELEAGVSVNSVEGESDGFDDVFILKTSAVAGGRFIPQECKRIAARDRLRAHLNPRKGSIIISRMNTPDLVGECGYVEQDYPNLFLPDRLWMTQELRDDVNASGKWLSSLLSTTTLKRQISAAATGTSNSMKNLSKQAFLQIRIALPRPAEQAAIATVLSDMDAELSALEARREKSLALKQALMQELLTGRTRLVTPEAVHA